MRRMSAITSFVVAIMGLFVAGRAFGQTYNLSADLAGIQEVPPNSSPGYGDAELTLNAGTGLVTITSGSYQDLLGNSSAVSINDAAAGSNGAVQIALTLDSPGTTAGTFSGSGTLSSGAITDMIAGNTYVNLRSNVYPSGEIRGQIEVVPEPSSLAILAGAGWLVLRRQRRHG